MYIDNYDEQVAHCIYNLCNICRVAVVVGFYLFLLFLLLFWLLLLLLGFLSVSNDAFRSFSFDFVFIHFVDYIFTMSTYSLLSTVCNINGCGKIYKVILTHLNQTLSLQKKKNYTKTHFQCCVPCFFSL